MVTPTERQIRSCALVRNFFLYWPMRGRPRKEIAVIHNKLARAQSDLSPLGMRIMVLLATRLSHDHDLLKHKLKVQEYKARLGLTGGSAYNTLEQVADEMLKSLVEVED